MILTLIAHDEDGRTTIFRLPATATIEPLDVADEFGVREVEVKHPDGRHFRDRSLGSALVELLGLEHPPVRVDGRIVGTPPPEETGGAR